MANRGVVRQTGNHKALLSSSQQNKDSRVFLSLLFRKSYLAIKNALLPLSVALKTSMERKKDNHLVRDTIFDFFFSSTARLKIEFLQRLFLSLSLFLLATFPCIYNDSDFECGPYLDIALFFLCIVQTRMVKCFFFL